MFSLTEKFSLLGAEFNKELGRNDGEFVAKLLHGRLEQDTTDWFYDRVFRMFDGLSKAEWSEADQSTSELRSRNEVSCFQAIEIAIVARDSRYVPANKAEWFADWCLRLTLGVGAPDAKQHRFPHYWNKGQDERVAGFCAVLAAALPETAYSYYFIVLYNRLLLLLTKATVSTAFNDHATAKTTLYEHNAVDSQLQTAINHFTSGGGVCYVVSSNGHMIITESTANGSLYYVWTTLELAQEMSKQHKEPTVSVLNYRDLNAHLSDLKRLNVQSIVVDLGGRWQEQTLVVPIEKFIEYIQTSIHNADTSEFGVAYYNAVS